MNTNSTPHRSVLSWAGIWVRTVVRSWRMRAHHIDSNLP